jgi:hypothetical protein
VCGDEAACMRGGAMSGERPVLVHGCVSCSPGPLVGSSCHGHGIAALKGTAAWKRQVRMDVCMRDCVLAGRQGSSSHSSAPQSSSSTWRVHPPPSSSSLIWKCTLNPLLYHHLQPRSRTSGGMAPASLPLCLSASLPLCLSASLPLSLLQPQTWCTPTRSCAAPAPGPEDVL